MRARIGASISICCALLAAGCATSPEPDGVQVVASTPVLADLARQVAGERAHVTDLVPPGADPHTAEPTLRDVRAVANADVVLANGLLLEPEALTRTLETSTRPGVRVTDVAHEATGHGAHLIPLVENAALDSVWLGLRVRGAGASRGVTRTSEITVTATDITGPGTLSAFVTGTFGQPEPVFAPTRGADTARLPVGAHTHLSWAFTEAGEYRMDLRGGIDGHDCGTGQLLFAVGVDPHAPGRTVIDTGHQDLTVDLDACTLSITGDAGTIALDKAIISVPGTTYSEIPPDPRFRFLGRPGQPAYMLAQAVLGRHLHGEMDPHLWLDVSNAIAYVDVIEQALTAADPAGGPGYARRAEDYRERLRRLDHTLQETVAAIPPQRRHLITTHDAYGYLAKAYGLDVAGFVSPNPSVPASATDLVRLTRTLNQLSVPAVFLEPQLASRSGELTSLARDNGVEVCPIYSDSFDPAAGVDSYLSAMTATADSLRRCLGPGAAGGGGSADPPASAAPAPGSAAPAPGSSAPAATTTTTHNKGH
ncbi:anchored repeat ABC transporter, substrate-binding protein [Corynebacterium uberis]|uniref:anchored repeat ABC transporter, substrate-binding protein n=1 Tax=Corynebacterium TaxID=1716 RepID=UPI001D0A443A|nr:anchored repeat ABC transporter, substrate-binding protein [Corynebacterium uberis]MCZ9309540.1 anchored repeat ABC transporter, substrate-binding protein [Corynebacterium sp. c6VSa_13]UDL73086.1 anchored repeat ABC transporter, substrate-binding protein [Corynebacterium uberis]UDL76037.1 anchored repeat ABC transporter, substrate-binding protein [Corynebacterium uberis]UDL78249.1 anchored repeat ABC transporter, substrate-binding protein [Corynebacterium uberis]UDL80532.1 anchored repeat A